MTLIGYRSSNHPQQVARRSPLADIDDRATDPAVFAWLHGRFRFTIDAAASAGNARLPRYWTVDDDALSKSWAGERVWCNPPYSHPNLRFWTAKAWAEHAHCPLIVMIVPANRTEQPWWQSNVEPYRDRGKGLRTEFLPGRIRFLRSGAHRIGPDERPPLGCCLLIWESAAMPP